jgi:hypothetical protein
LFTTIVAVFQLRPAAAAAVTEDVPLPGGTAALAQALGIDPVPDRSRFMFEITRLLYNTPEGRRPSADAFLQALRQSVARGRRQDVPVDTRPAELVPVPLTAELWSSAIFHRQVAPRELVTAIVADRAAALICLGLATLDDRTLEYFADHPLLLERIHERSAPAFGAFSSSLRIQDNRIVPPGVLPPFDPSTSSGSSRAQSRDESLRVAPSNVEGRQAQQGQRDDVTALWEAVIPEKMTRPDRFMLQLLELNEGRFLYLYDVIGQLDPPRRAFALGLWMTNATARAERFKALTAGVGMFRESQLRTLPLGRASYDLSMTLMRIAVGPDGTPLPPASRGLWSRVFGGTDLPDDPARQLRNAEDDPIDAAWLIDTIGSVEVRLRAERLDQIAFGQRVFADAAGANERGDVFIALRAFSRYRMLMWTFERIGIRAPAAYATAARRAARIGALEGRRGFEAQAQFQGALALVARMAGVRTLDAPRAQKLVEQLVALSPAEDGRFAGAVGRWLRDDLAAAIASAPTTEAAILAAMSGPPSGDGPIARAVTWEGQAYHLDLGAAERRRLQRVREKQEGVPLDAALDVAAAGRALRAEKLALDDAESIAARLNAVAPDIPRRVGHDGEDSTPAGLTAAPNAADALRKAIDELAREIRNKDVKRAARMAEPLIELGDALLAEVLLSIAYAADVGDPDGTVLLADDVSRRHDFGFSARDAEMRARMPWAVPRADVTPGVPWHITGSLLGLDIGLAPLALRRLNYERVLEAPKLTSNERDAFALSVSLMSPFALHDADRDAIADAIERGRHRVAALTTPSDRAGAASRPNDDAAVDRLADELSMEGWRRRAVRWTLAHEANRVESMFSATEMLVLGGGKTADFDAWGMAMVTVQGCVCSRLTPPGRWPNLLGRPQLGLTATAVADLNLHVAIMLKELHLPAELAKVVLSGAMQDFIDEVRPTDDADWLTLSRAARIISRARIEDYIAAATAAGPLMDAGLRRQD